MSILKVAYELCKTVIKSPLREEVSVMMNEIKKFQEVQIGEKLDKYEMGKTIRNQSAEKANIQFYGYLIADSKRKEIEKEFNRLVPELSQEHFDLLTKLQREFIFIDEKIINLLPSNLIHRSTLNPYSMYGNIVTKDGSFKSSLFTEEQLDRLKSSFRRHKGFQEIGKIPVDLYSELNKISDEKIENANHVFTDRLYKAGVMTHPNDMLEAIRGAKRGNAVIPVKYIFSLMCIRESIHTLNQLIYQAFLQDKLPVFNEDNLISIKSSSHLGGKGYSLKSQYEYSLKPRDLVHVIDPYDTNPFPILCQIESATISFNNEFGSHEDLKLRVIDEDLNPFQGILESLNYKYK
ncbi:hypothetical protein [Pseudalkalibacillus salsuginis]|uniref:hypothetical protein n=1 Tax=Pseudalkalibacillus salsuginis TaxID=2910972 RepID=UPI001F460A61|nr:hypothetical protein [Pseudalkalibacillus salsuginis]MCF6409560.1 hypothetical protein [Pseudalkalibacillus salsuginis]